MLAKKEEINQLETITLSALKPPQTETSTQINKPLLKEIHSDSIQNDQTSLYDQIKIIETLGGIDKILSDYFDSENEMVLTQTQLNTLHKLIAVEERQVEHATTIDMLRLESYSQNTSKWTITKINSPIYSCFKRVFANKLMEYIYSKWTITIALLFNFIWIIWIIVNPYNVEYYVFKLLTNMITTTILVLVFLTANKRAMKKITRSFVFWFKTYTIFKVVIAHLLLVYYVNYYDDDIGTDPVSNLRITADIMMQTQYTLLVIIFASVDSYPMSVNTKVITGSAISLIITISAITNTIAAGKQEANLYFLGSDSAHHLELASLKAGGLRTLAAFFWSQTYNSWRHKGKGIVIKERPIMHWTD